MNSLEKNINTSIEKLSKTIYPLKEIIKEILNIVNQGLPLCSISIYMIDPESKNIEYTMSNKELWPIPYSKIKWFTKNTSQQDKNKNQILHIPNRKKSILTDFKQLKKDQNNHSYSCDDYLFMTISNEEYTTGIILVHSWHHKKPLKKVVPNFSDNAKLIAKYLSDTVIFIENYQVHKKIETLLSDKKKLTLRIQEDEQSLKRRVLELTTLYETSSDISHSLDYSEIITKTVSSLNKVLNYDSCSILLKDIFKPTELFVTLGKQLPDRTIKSLKNIILNSAEAFFPEDLNSNEINETIHILDKKNRIKTPPQFNSHSNVPLIFRNQIIGIITVSSFKKDAFQKNEIQFLHTLANNIASTLGKIKIIRDLEKSKIYSVLESINDPIIIIDEKHQVQIINPYAEKLLNLPPNSNISKEKLINLLNTLSLLDLYHQVKSSEKPILNQQASYNDQNFTVNISPVINNELGFVGIIFLFRDITNIQHMDRIKTQRLDAISKVNLIINSIENLNHLLEVLMDFLLNITNCNMGSIQLMQNGSFVTSVHKNFPEKIRRSYRYKNRKTISQEVEETKRFILIDDYFSNTSLNPDVKILIDLYLCIPIIINSQLIGIINLTRKFGSTENPFTKEDIDTLLTVTSLAATTIHNSLLYEEKLQKEKLDQEIKVATKIQKNLLPTALPEIEKLNFGILNIPAQEIGGDFYDFIKLDNNRLGIIISDIVGKGIPAGLYMAVLKSILNRNILSELSPKETLHRLNNIMFNDPVINKFIPLFYGIFDQNKKEFKYANAGHEPGYILREKEFITLDSYGFPLGGCKNQSYEEKKVTLKEDDLFMFFTDGIIDVKNPNNKSFEVKGIKKFLMQHRNYPPQLILNKLKVQLNNFSENVNKRDDITAIICKYNKLYENTSKLILEQEVITTSETSQIKIIRNKIKEICTLANFNSKTILDIQLSINEAQANIIEHAYLGDPNKKITFHFKLFSDKLETIIKDNGLTLKNNKLNKRTSIKIDEIEGSGLGIFLINTLMDEIIYEPKNIGTKLKLVKYNLN